MAPRSYEPEELEQYHQLYSDELMGMACNLVRRRDVAEEIVQQAFLKAASAIQSYELRQPRAWLCRVTRNLAYDYLRARRTTCTSLQPSDLEHVVHGDSVSEPLDIEERRQRLHESVSKLPSRYRLVLEMRYLDGLGPAEIAVNLDISVSNAKVLTHRARGLLKELIDEEEFDDRAI